MADNKFNRTFLPFEEEVFRLSTDSDWGKIRSVFKNERQYLVEILKDIDLEIKKIKARGVISADHPFKIEISIDHFSGDPNEEIKMAVKYLKESFLGFLQQNEVIRGLKFRWSADEEDGAITLFVATFTIDKPLEFASHATSLIRAYMNNLDIKAMRRHRGGFSMRGGCVYWGTKKIFEKGQAAIFTAMYEKRSIKIKGKEEKTGESIARKELENVGPYDTELSFRDALKKMRAKLEKEKLSTFVEITNSRKNHYLLVTNDLDE